MEYLKPREAAELMNISYVTLKKWIYKKKIRSVKTKGGHHRIPISEVSKFTAAKKSKRSTHVTAALDNEVAIRNRLPGVITDIQVEGFFAQITLDVYGGEVFAIINKQTLSDHKLEKGARVFLHFKATEVILSRR